MSQAFEKKYHAELTGEYYEYTPEELIEHNITGHPQYGETSDIGNSLRLRAMLTDQARWTEAGWFSWNGKYLESVESPVWESTYLPGAIQAEAAELPSSDSERAKALMKWAQTSANAAKLSAAVKLCQIPKPPLYVPVTQLDAAPYLINTPNGAVDLTSGAAWPTEIGDNVTKITTGRYIRGLAPGIFHAFLETTLPDPEVRDYVQRMLGYSIFGHSQQECMYIMYGNGQNGKGTLTMAIEHALGEYAYSVMPSLLAKTKFQEHPQEIAQLRGRRVVFVHELDRGDTLDEGKFKHLTGGDKLNGRFMRQNSFEFNPTHTLWMTSNYLPPIKNADAGILRRFKIIPFDVCITAAQRDETLKARLRDAADEVLTWLVDGAIRHTQLVQAGEDTEPLAVTIATDEYKAMYASAATFVGMYLEPCDDKAQMTSFTQIRDAYILWAAHTAKAVNPDATLRACLLELGYDKHHTRAGNKHACRIKPELADTMDASQKGHTL